MMPSILVHGIVANVSTTLVLAGISEASFSPSEQAALESALYSVYPRLASPSDVRVTTVAERSNRRQLRSITVGRGSKWSRRLLSLLDVTVRMRLAQAGDSSVPEFTNLIRGELVEIINASNAPGGMNELLAAANCEIDPGLSKLSTEQSLEILGTARIIDLRPTPSPTPWIGSQAGKDTGSQNISFLLFLVLITGATCGICLAARMFCRPFNPKEKEAPQTGPLVVAGTTHKNTLVVGNSVYALGPQRSLIGTPDGGDFSAWDPDAPQTPVIELDLSAKARMVSKLAGLSPEDDEDEGPEGDEDEGKSGITSQTQFRLQLAHI